MFRFAMSILAICGLILVEVNAEAAVSSKSYLSPRAGMVAANQEKGKGKKAGKGKRNKKMKGKLNLVPTMAPKPIQPNNKKSGNKKQIKPLKPNQPRMPIITPIKGNANKEKKQQTSASPTLVPPSAYRSHQQAGKNDSSSSSGAISTIPPELGTPLNPKSKIYFDFDEGADLMDILAEISEKLRINFIVGDKVKGQKIIIRCPNPITPHEAWLAFLSALQMRGLTVIKVGKFYKVISFKDAMKSPAPILYEGRRVGADEAAVTYIYHLKYLAVKDIEQVLKQLKSKEGDIVAFLPTNSFIITDTGLNVRRMLKLLKQVDVPGRQDKIHIVEVFYADVNDLANQINQIFGEKAKGKTPPVVHANIPKPGITGRHGSKGAPKKGGEEPITPTVTKVIPDERTNQLIIVCPDDTLPEVLGLIRELDVPVPGEGQVHIYYLENANAEDVASTLSNLAQGSARSKRGGKKAATASLFEGEVKITADKSTNSLVIVASPKDYASLKKVIRQLDIKRRQVFVEAVIMEVTLSKNRTFGVGFNGGVMFDIGGEKVPIFGATTLGALSSIVLDPTALQGLAIGLKGPDLEGTEGLILPGVSIPAFGVVLQALQTDANANVLSTPHILTMDNEEAQIVVGSNVPFITGQARDYNNRPILQIQRQDVAITMKIKPQINESDYVRLNVEQEVTEVVSISPTLGPTTTKRAAKTVVVVKDGQTVVIGGLMKDKTSEDISKVPFFGDIPVIGRLFKYTKTVKEKANLLIFLTPYIVRDEQDFKKIFKRKMRERAEFLRQFYGKADEYEPPIDWDKKVGALETIYSTIRQEKMDAEAAAAGSTYIMHNGRKVKTLGKESMEDTNKAAAHPSEVIKESAPAPVKVEPAEEAEPAEQE